MTELYTHFKLEDFSKLVELQESLFVDKEGEE